jgi:type II secretory pathway pseudopilin PulG
MVEIALSLAIIGFALVAIIGILPLAMNVQRENREETLINQDANMLLEALRNGARGMDDLTNYVISVTNVWARYDDRLRLVASGFDWYTPFSSSTSPVFALTNGARIVGLLSTPKYLPDHVNGGFVSNQVVANIRAMSGSVTDKYPQNNAAAREMAFAYRLVPEVITYGYPVSQTLTNNGWHESWTDYYNYATNTPEYAARLHYLGYATNLQNNLHDVRLIFRWPLLANGQAGTVGRQVFCTTVGGKIVLTNDYTQPTFGLFYLQPTLFTTNAL